MDMPPKPAFHLILALAVATLHAEGARSLLPSAGFLFLTANSVLAAYRSREDPWTLAFVIAAYANLLLLFGCLRAYDKAPELDVRRRETLKLSVLISASTLNLLFTYCVSRIMPFPFSAAVWSLAGVVVVAGGFYSFYVHGGAADGGNCHEERREGDGSEKYVGASRPGGARGPAGRS